MKNVTIILIIVFAGFFGTLQANPFNEENIPKVSENKFQDILDKAKIAEKEGYKEKNKVLCDGASQLTDPEEIKQLARESTGDGNSVLLAGTKGVEKVEDVLILAKFSTNGKTRDAILEMGFDKCQSFNEALSLALACLSIDSRNICLAKAMKFAATCEDFIILADRSAEVPLTDKLLRKIFSHDDYLLQGALRVAENSDFIKLAEKCKSRENRNKILVQSCKRASTIDDLLRLVNCLDDSREKDKVLVKFSLMFIDFPDFDKYISSFSDQDIAMTNINPGFHKSIFNDLEGRGRRILNALRSKENKKLLLCNYANHAGIHNKPENLKILQKMASGIVSTEKLQKSFNEGVSFSKLPVLGNIVKQN